MTQASCFLIGKYDFSAFRSSQCQAKSPIRSIQKITINKKKENYIYIRLTGKSFLHNQVRIIVGTLVYVGKKKTDAKTVKEILSSKRRERGPTAPAHGLYLEKIIY